MKNKLLMAALSLVLAFGMWLYVITTVSPGSTETFYNIAINLEGETVLEERGLMITSISASSVTMTLSGTRTDLSKVDSNTITIRADLTSIYDPGTRIPLSYTTSFPGNVASNALVIESRSPSRIYINVERRVSRSVPVEIRWVGSADEGYLADRENRTLDTDTVQISGPQDVVDRIEKAVVEIDLTGQRESISQAFSYTLCDADGEPVDAELVTASVEEIRVDVKIQRVKDLALTYTLTEGGGATADNVQIALSVDTIRVSGSDAVLERLGDELVLGTINLAEITENCDRVFTIQLEEGVTNLTGVTEVTAEIRLTGLTTREFLITDIQPVNIPDGMAVELYTRELTVYVRGPSALVETLTEKDITVTVDFTGAEPGASTYKARTSFSPEFYALGTVMDGSVSAQVTAVETEADAQAAE